jgi:hypothetical protein
MCQDLAGLLSAERVRLDDREGAMSSHFAELQCDTGDVRQGVVRKSRPDTEVAGRERKTTPEGP